MNYKSTFNDDLDFNVAIAQFLAQNKINEDDIFSIVYLGDNVGGIGYDIFVRG
jgi:hypothetical protein